MSPLNFDDPGWPKVYTPVKQGLRHLTDEPTEPPAGLFVEFLCGGITHVGYEPATPIIYDCPHCAEVYRERYVPPTSRVAPSRLVHSPPGGRTWGPAGVAPPAPAGPRPLGMWHLAIDCVKRGLGR